MLERKKVTEDRIVEKLLHVISIRTLTAGSKLLSSES